MLIVVNCVFSAGLKDVIIYLQADDKTKNRGFCFLEYVDHKSASQVIVNISAGIFNGLLVMFNVGHRANISNHL